MNTAVTARAWAGATEGSFRTPTVADIPGLQNLEALPHESARERDARPLNYADARGLLDFIARRGENMGPAARQLFDATLPTIREAYSSMLVEVDRLTADLEEALLAPGPQDESHTAGGARGDGYVTLATPAPPTTFDRALIDDGYEALRTLGTALARMNSERVTASAERIELCYLALETDVQLLENRLLEAEAARARLVGGKSGNAARSGAAAMRRPGRLPDVSFAPGAEAVRSFEENGCLGPLTLCSEAEMGRIRRWIDRAGFMHGPSPIYGESSPRGSAEARDWHLVLPEIYELCTHPSVVAVMKALLGPDLILWRSQFMRKESGANALAWHQDGSFPGGAAMPAVDPVKTISAWIAIDDTRVENGCVWVIPGTHKGTLEYTRKDANRGQGLFGRGFEVEYAVPPERAVPMVLRPGQFMIFDCQTLHGSSHNPSPRRRLGLACRYTSADVRVYPGQTVDGQGYALDNFGCILVCGEDRHGHNVMREAPRR